MASTHDGSVGAGFTGIFPPTALGNPPCLPPTRLPSVDTSSEPRRRIAQRKYELPAQAHRLTEEASSQRKEAVMEFSATVDINRPVDAVFAQFSDVERAPEWSRPVAERQKLTEGPVGVGTAYRAVDKAPGRTLRHTMTVTVY